MKLYIGRKSGWKKSGTGLKHKKAGKSLVARQRHSPLTYHGLRYSYVQERMEHLQNEGFSRDAAAQIVSQEVGHERIEVINVYAGRS